MYAAATLNDHNPWSFVMPELSSYLQRVSFALRQGKPVTDVALLLPNDDVWATFFARTQSTDPVVSQAGYNTSGSDLSIDESLSHSLVTPILQQVLDSGFNVDFIDADAIDSLGIPYAVLILPGVDRLPLETYKKIEAYARHGGIVIAARSLPSTAPGLLETNSDQPKIREVSQRLFSAGDAPGHFIPDEAQLGSSLASYLSPDLILSPKTPRIGFIHRKLEIGDLYFIANTSNLPHHVQASFRSPANHAQWWDPFTGKIYEAENTTPLVLDLQPYESRLLLLTDSELPLEKAPPTSPSDSKTIDLSAGWNVSFGRANETIAMPKLRSWIEDPTRKFFSGQASYMKKFVLQSADLNQVITAVLDFGAGTPIPEPAPLPEHSMKAYLEGPIREAAEVYVNGESAGFVWRPPYSLDITKFLTPGENELRIIVGNTAINSLAGQTPPTYRLLNQRYGERFVPQDMGHLEPLPSGILGPLQLLLQK
jgi:hypothetical protein